MTRSVLRLVAAAVLLLLLAAPALAQGRIVFTDPGGLLDRAAVQRAAQPLINRGAEVAVYLVPSGDINDFHSRLTKDGLLRDSLYRTKMIAIYVALDSRYSSISSGDGWNEALTVNNNRDLIRTQKLNPGLSSKDYTAAFTATLGAIEAAIVSPPSPNGSLNISTVPLAILGLVLAVAIGGGALYTSRRRAAKIKADADRQLKDAREGAAALITDLGQRFRNAEEKAQYDQVSYAPRDVDRLREAQAAAKDRFVTVQTHFDDVGEQLERDEKPQLAQINASAAAYIQVRDEAASVAENLAAVEQIRTSLDELARQAPGEIARAKKS
ncbi:MAG: TPM domain-containing protein [Chloroflexales bacterium]|jgi:hypothetical protein